jgi:hypothetical protein
MSLSTLRTLLAWCTLFHVVLLFLWFFLMQAVKPWVYGLWSRWYKLSHEQFDALNFGGLLLYKLIVIVFVVAPLLALLIMGDAAGR